MERQRASTGGDASDLEVIRQVEAGTRRMLNPGLAVDLTGGRVYVCLKAVEHMQWISPLVGCHFVLPLKKVVLQSCLLW